MNEKEAKAHYIRWKEKELKTLKDLETDSADLFTNYAVASDTLKAEAIKWVKRHQAMAMKTDLVEDFIKHFFNLTEEDLQ